MNTPQLAQAGILDLITHSGPVAQSVLLLLLFLSIACWTIILMKWRSLSRASRENAVFLEMFWTGKSIDEILAKTDKTPASPVASVFKSGVKELKKISPAEMEPGRGNGVENIQRALSRATNTEVAAFEKHVGWLATTASAAPFIGLFGTVWGIMNAFQNIGATGAANLAVVAPGISEALITTATGIAAAIPAVVAYNSFANQIRRQAVDMESFTQDFLNIVQRSFVGSRKVN